MSRWCGKFKVGLGSSFNVGGSYLCWCSHNYLSSIIVVFTPMTCVEKHVLKNTDVVLFTWNSCTSKSILQGSLHMFVNYGHNHRNRGSCVGIRKLINFSIFSSALIRIRYYLPASPWMGVLDAMDSVVWQPRVTKASARLDYKYNCWRLLFERMHLPPTWYWHMWI